MNSVLQLFLISCAILFSTIVIRLLIKNKIGERNSVIWLGGLLLFFLLTSKPSIFDEVARSLGFHYPPALLFFLSSLLLLTISLYQTVQITKLSTKIKDISQFIALNFDENHTKCSAVLEKEEHSANGR